MKITKIVKICLIVYLSLLNTYISASEHINKKLYNKYLIEGTKYELSKNYDKAIKYYKKAALENNNSFTVYSDLASMYYKKHEYNKVIKHYKHAILLDKTKLSPYITLGLIYFELNQYEKSNKNFIKYLDLEKKLNLHFGDDVNLYKMISSNYDRMQDYKNAIKYYELIKKIRPKDFNKNYYMYLAHSYYQIKDYVNAIKTLKYMKNHVKELKIPSEKYIDQLIKETQNKMQNKI